MPPAKRPRRRYKRLNGEGTISGPRKDCRYVGAFYALTTAGTAKRVYVYGRSREEAHERLVAEQAKAAQGIPVPAKSWRLGPYLDYWLQNVVKPTRRPATYALYEINIRLHLAPGLGKHQLKRLSVPTVQAFLNAKLCEGQSVRNVQIMRQILSAALSRAVREELIVRNVARLVELPTWEPAVTEPWSPAEALAFLRAAFGDRSTRRSYSCCCTECAAARSLACTGRMSTLKPRQSTSASKSCGSRASCTSARSRPVRAAVTCR